MSLILDALRKSETERRRGQSPGLFTPLPAPGLGPARRSSPLPWLVAVGVVAAVASAWWFWPLKPAAVPAKAVVPAVAADVAPPPVLVPTPPTAPVDKAVRASRDAAPHDIVVPPPVPATIAPATPADNDVPLEDLPTLATLDPSERATLPPLKLSMHVWSEAPNARLAIIDGQRVMEGATVGESIVAEIRRDGVVLEWHGRRFLLPRP